MKDRRTAILETLRDEGRVLVGSLATRIGVSEMTIRRDLSELETAGIVTRTHGGAVPTGRLRFLLSAFPHYELNACKAAIGKHAAGLVRSGQTVMLDTGTTALEVARHLPQDTAVTVLTTSLCVAQELYGSALNVLLLGGFLRKEFPSLYGPLTESMLGSFHIDLLFMGCDGAHAVEGFYSADLHVSSLEQAMIRIADRVVVVTESHKFGKKSFVRYATPEKIHTLVTDGGLSGEDRARLREQGVHIVIADEK